MPEVEALTFEVAPEVEAVAFEGSALTKEVEGEAVPQQGGLGEGLK
jgi:hypothetical protein